MPVYKFELNDGVWRVEDEIGVDLPDRRRALEHACAVVREMMGGCEAQTRSWRLNVYDGGGQRLFEIPFASLDRTLDHLAPELRTMVAELSHRVCSLKEALGAAIITLRESRALVARSRGRPYQVTHLGERTIR